MHSATRWTHMFNQAAFLFARLKKGRTMKIEALQERFRSLTEDAQAITAAAEAAGRDLSTEEAATLDSILAALDRTAADIDRLNRLSGHTAGRKTEAAQPAQSGSEETPPAEPLHTPARRAPIISAMGENYVLKKTGGFHSLGEFSIAVRRASIPGGGGVIDKRLELINQAYSLAPTTFANEGVGSEGGFAVPTDFRTAIMEKVLGDASLLSRTDQITVSGNTLTIPKDNGTPWGTTGIRAYWGNEGGLKTQSRPAFDSMTLRLHKVYSLVPVTDELAEDSPAMDSYLRRKAPEAIDFAINLAIVQGTGANQPLGILNSPATVSVAKETSQLADTIVANNIIKMWSRMYAPNRSKAVWLVSQDIETQLYTMALPGKDNTGASVTGWGSHVFMPAGGLSGNPYSTLFGRPVIPTQACNELGDKGDIILADLAAYLTALKSGVNPKVDVSIHLWFEYDISAYRFVLRLTGLPWWDAPITPRDGANTLSPFVTLDERG